MTKNYDIVIIGGGLVGAAMALALAGIAQRYNLTIAILDKGSPANAHGVNTEASILDARATALALGSRHLLDSISIWPALAAYAQAIERIDVSDQGQKFGTQMYADEMQQHALGYVIQNQHLLQVFWHYLQHHCQDCVHLIPHTTVTNIANARTHSQLTYECVSPETAVNNNVYTNTITCQLIIMADGGKSSLREQMGIHQSHHSYEQIALVVNAKMSQPHDGLACERFTAQGPMAGLPLLAQTGTDKGNTAEQSPQDHSQQSHSQQGYSAMVWTQPLSRQGEIEAMDDKQLMAELQQQMGDRLGTFEALGTRQIYPLTLSVAQEQVRQGLAIVGNAAHTLHPIAGQGFNLALRGVFALAEQVYKACEDGQPIGDLGYLQRFIAQGKQDQKRTIVASDQIMKLFTSRQKSLLIGRQLGFLAMDRLPLMKKMFTRAAMGLDRPMAKVLPLTIVSDGCQHE